MINEKRGISSKRERKIGGKRGISDKKGSLVVKERGGLMENGDYSKKIKENWWKKVISGKKGDHWERIEEH